MDSRGAILIVDHDSAGRNDWASILFRPGFRLNFATNGDDAIRKASVAEPSLILIDAVSVSGQNGFDVSRRFRRNASFARIPILLAIAADDPSAPMKTLESGADGFLTKPINPDEARSRIRMTLRLSRIRMVRDEAERLHRAEQEVNHHRLQLETLSRRLLQAQEEERRAIARELHDEVGQILTVLKINLVLTHRGLHDTMTPQRISESIDLVDRLIDQVRDLWRNLRPSLLDELGLPAALHVLVDSTSKRTGVDMELETDPEIERLAPDREITCYRVVQESLTNVIRHARAKRVRVILMQSKDSLLLTITDDGVGFDVNDVLSNISTKAHMGLLGMRERISLIGGVLRIQSRPGQGTRVRISLPLCNCSGVDTGDEN